jgi:hypothetical protein
MSAALRRHGFERSVVCVPVLDLTAGLLPVSPVASAISVEPRRPAHLPMPKY